jgi:hypothetical protein
VDGSGIILPPWVDPEDLDTIVLQPSETVVVYRCPVCRNIARSDLAGMAPVCTGPTWRDDHEMTVMEKIDA